MTMDASSSSFDPPAAVLDGFWLPASLRQNVLKEAAFEIRYLKGGALLEEPTPGAVAVRWPVLDAYQWQVLQSGLQAARKLDTHSFLARWGQALEFCLPDLPKKLEEILPYLATATGYSPEMLLRGFLSGSLSQVNSIAAGLSYRPDRANAAGWQSIPGLPGKLHFYPHLPENRLARLLPRLGGQAAFYRPAPPTAQALCLAAGNVPGTAFLVALLGGLANAAYAEAPAPALLVRNSRHEPLFAPWLFSMIEGADPELVAATAILAWDYDDLNLQARLIAGSEFVIAAAGDDTMLAIDQVIRKANPAARFHKHGHKVSFSAIGREYAGVEETAALGALDSSLWDQNGCLSARVHFVEGEAAAYAANLAKAMGDLSREIPRGATPRRFVHRAFDTFFSLEKTGKVKVFSGYDDPFAVILETRPWDADAFRRVTNACVGRVAVVRPVQDLSEIGGYLRRLPPENLQTVGLACEAGRLLPLAELAGSAGVTAVRSLGRAAFPQLAYSWDGYLPLDTAFLRPEGHWTGLEVDAGEI